MNIAEPHVMSRMKVLVLMPHSRCNCRCIMCDIWKANRNGTSLDEDTLRGLMDSVAVLGTEYVLLSGGEPLMHANLWALCRLLKAQGLTIGLLSTGLLLEKHAADVVRWCDEVIVSLDGPPATHDRVRGIGGAFDKLAAGVAALKTAQPGFAVSARCVLQKANFRTLPATIDAARDAGLDRISFLAADLTSTAFNRPESWTEGRSDDVGLDAAETEEFAAVIEDAIARQATAFADGFIAESPAKLRRLAQYYRAANGAGEFPPVRCNAPWVSAVIEADGVVRPCFFHPAIGNIHRENLATIVNGPAAVQFRRALDVAQDPVCKRCVCSFNG